MGFMFQNTSLKRWPMWIIPILKKGKSVSGIVLATGQLAFSHPERFSMETNGLKALKAILGLTKILIGKPWVCCTVQYVHQVLILTLLCVWVCVHTVFLPGRLTSHACSGSCYIINTFLSLPQGFPPPDTTGSTRRWTFNTSLLHWWQSKHRAIGDSISTSESSHQSGIDLEMPAQARSMCVWSSINIDCSELQLVMQFDMWVCVW